MFIGKMVGEEMRGMVCEELIKRNEEKKMYMEMFEFEGMCVVLLMKRNE